MALPEEEYILKWNDHKNNFFNLMTEDLFQQELLTDLTVCCGETLFNAHRLVLSVCSPYFRTMLTNAPTNKFPIIFLNDIHPTDFERLLQFMYYGEVRIPNSDLEPLIRTATSLKIKGLSAHPGGQELTSHYGSRSPAMTSAKEPPPQQQQQQHQQQQQTPLKKRRLSSSDSSESRLNHLPPAMAFSYETLAQTRIPTRSPLPLQQQQQPRIPYRSESVRATSPIRVRTPPSSILQENRALSRPSIRGRSPPSDGSQSSTSSSLPPRLKEEAFDETPVSPPPQTDSIPLLISGSDPLQRKALGTSNLSHTQPRTETRKTGTCYFCKKAFMKNKQLMNHVCPKKPKGGSNNPGLNVTRVRSPGVSPMSTALALLSRK